MTHLPRRRAEVGFLLALGLLSVALLAMLSLIAHQRALTRGIGPRLPEPLPNADVSPFCINTALSRYSDGELDAALDRIADGGFFWLRQTFPWALIEPVPGQYDWQEWDRLVEAATARGLHIIAVLDTAPDWAGHPPPPADFARFAGAFAARYGEHIRYYQVWNNPNLTDGWGAPPSPQAYAELLRKTNGAIRAADADAQIIFGSLAPTVEQGPQNLSEMRFLDIFYTTGAARYFDILAIQPYGFDMGPEERGVDEEQLNFSRAILLRERLIAYGDGQKAIWASHFGWNSLPADWEDVPSIWGQVDEETQAAYTCLLYTSPSPRDS